MGHELRDGGWLVAKCRPVHCDGKGEETFEVLLNKPFHLASHQRPHSKVLLKLVEHFEDLSKDLVILENRKKFILRLLIVKLAKTVNNVLCKVGSKRNLMLFLFEDGHPDICILRQTPDC